MTSISPATPWRVQLELHLTTGLDSTADTDLDLGAFIPTLHRIIQQQAGEPFPGLDEIWIDVVDYRHVEDGPGLLLVSHDAYYGIEHNRRRSTLLYRRRRPAAGPVQRLLLEAGLRLLAFAQCLAQEPAAADVLWRTERWTVSLQDRLLAAAEVANERRYGAPLSHFRQHLLGPDALTTSGTFDRGEPLTFELEGRRRLPLAALEERLTAALEEGQDDRRLGTDWPTPTPREGTPAEVVP